MKELKVKADKADKVPAVIESNSVAVVAPEPVVGFDAADILIPKILLMQGLSERVTDGAAVMGDMVDSLSGEKLGDKKTPIEFIPVASFKTWVVLDAESNEYIRTVPRNVENATWEREGSDLDRDGNDVRVSRYAVLNFYALRRSDIAGGEAFPYVISFRSTSYQAGKKLATLCMKQQMFKKPIWAKSALLSCAIEKNDRGTFGVLDVNAGTVCTGTEQEAASFWAKMLGQKAVKVDDSEFNSDLEAVKAETRF